MNSRPLLFLAAALTAASAGNAASDTTPKIACAAAQPGPLGSEGSIELGSSRAFVLSLIGAPAAKLSPDIWVYWNYKSNDDDANRRGYDTLVVTFTNGGVSKMKLVNEEPIRKWLALTEQRTPQRYAAARP